MRLKARERSHREEKGRWFHCVRCNRPVLPDALGTAHRNHCPWCLWSRHVDDLPGDRSADCGGAMEPITVWARRGGDWAVIHQCRSCGTIHSNRIAGDDNELALIALAARAIAQPPFPLERLSPACDPQDDDWPAGVYEMVAAK